MTRTEGVVEVMARLDSEIGGTERTLEALSGGLGGPRRFGKKARVAARDLLHGP